MDFPELVRPISVRPTECQRGFELSIPLPFDEALKAAMKVPADKLAKPNGKTAKPPKRAKKP